MNRSKEQETIMLQTIGRKNLTVKRVEHDKKWAIQEKIKQLSDCIECLENDEKPKPNLILNRNGEKAIVLKWSNHNIEGWKLGKAHTKQYKIDSLKEVSDIWLANPANQELVWEVHQEMTEALREARTGNSEEVVH